MEESLSRRASEEEQESDPRIPLHLRGSWWELDHREPSSSPPFLLLSMEETRVSYNQNRTFLPATDRGSVTAVHVALLTSLCPYQFSFNQG